GHEMPLQRIRQMAPGKHVEAGVLRMILVQAGQHTLGAERRIVLRTWKEIVDALVVRAVRPEGLSPRVELVPPRIHHPAGEHLEAARSRLHPPDAAAVETPHPPGRLDIAVRVDALVDVERAIGTPAERVDEMMGVGAAESAKD